MSYVIFAILVGTIGLAFCQGWLIRQLRNCYSKKTNPWPADQPWPKAAVVLSLRGNDPFLENCLRNLVLQDYPDFFLTVTVDSETDPAWKAIHAVQDQFGDDCMTVSVLGHRRPNCSLKNSSIIQAVSGLPDDCEVVAFVDADAIKGKDIKGFPTFVLTTANGTTAEYKGGRTAPDMLAFINTTLGGNDIQNQ